MYLNLPNIVNTMYIHSVADKSNSSTYSKYCGNLQADQHSHLLLSPRLITLLTFIYASVHVSIFVLTVCFKLSNVVFQIFPFFFCLEISTGFMSYILFASQEIPHLLWNLKVCYHAHESPWEFNKKMMYKNVVLKSLVFLIGKLLVQ
jgi:hypothetical protein